MFDSRNSHMFSTCMFEGVSSVLVVYGFLDGRNKKSRELSERREGCGRIDVFPRFFSTSSSQARIRFFRGLASI